MDRPELALKAIIWDMDGTIFDTERLRIDCWEEVCLANNYPNSRAVLQRCLGLNVPDSNKMLRKGLGDDFPIDRLRKEKNILEEKKIKESGVPIKEGIVEALEWVTTRKIPNALASSSEYDRIVARLEATNLKRHFKDIVGGNHVTRGKPHPDVFLAAAEKLGIAPDHCIVFEDSHNGIIAADEAGMHVVMIPDLVPPTEEILKRTDHLLTSGTEIIALLSRLFPDI